MFEDLMDLSIQPEKINVSLIPEIELSETLKLRLNDMFKQEENAYSKVSGTTSIVQTQNSYVFFSNQWLYLAVKCRKYAEALYKYCDFFDNKIKINTDVINCVKTQNFSAPAFVNFFESDVDKDRMQKFIVGNSTFRPGKNLVNSGDKIRSCKDIFGSCILGKIDVPNASSEYLGNLVYYLSKRPELYAKLEQEIQNQTHLADLAKKLPTSVKDCAKAIVDYAYEYDKFNLLKTVLEPNEKYIKINTSNMDEPISSGNFLRYLFAKQSSENYETLPGTKPRVFDDKEYKIDISGTIEECRLTTQWSDSDIDISQGGNYLKALIQVVNKYYSGIFKIIDVGEERYLIELKNNFKLNMLPMNFSHDEFARRLITSLLAKPFVILTGNSGSGKTRIAKQFAEYLECLDANREKNWSLVPVGADWTDNTKILGFFNPLAQNEKDQYIKTNIFKLIENANINKNVPYFLILDEMNLSHVERYFADFLSHMETPTIPFKIDGFGELQFPSNLFIIGTVNIDETTYMFSPKVLDRANVIEFKPKKDEVLKLFTEVADSKNIYPANDGTAEAFLKLAHEICSDKCAIENEMNDVMENFKKVYEIVSKYDQDFAFRTVKEIRRYISAANEIGEGNINLSNAEDEQLLQKILPKIHGNKKEIGNMLEELRKLCEESKFDLSKNKIEQMERKLAQVQYASFI